MKILRQKINVIAAFMMGEDPKPLRFQYTDTQTKAPVTVKVQNILQVRHGSEGPSAFIEYECQDIFPDGRERRYVLRFRKGSSDWILQKL